MDKSESKTQARLKQCGAYTSYQYISSDSRPTYDYVDQYERQPGIRMNWPEDVEDTAQAFEETHTIVSAHDHLSLRPKDPSLFAEYRRNGREATPYQGMARSGVDLFFDGGPAAVSMIRSHTPFAWDDAVSDLGMRASDWAHQDFAVPIGGMADLRALRRDQVGIVPTLETATPIGNDVDRLDILYGLGLRMIGVAYSESNALASGLSEEADGGLTHLGRRAIRRMNELGIMIDVSHTADRSARDVIESSEDPVSITHAGARALWNTSRMKPDEVIRAVAASGGFIGVEAAPHTTLTAAHPHHSLESVMEHMEYCIELVGIDHVAFGPDTNFGDHAAWHREFGPLFGIGGESKEQHPPYDPVEYVSGCENPGESVPNMVRWCFAHGYSENDVAKLAGENVLRVAQQVWAD